jgi:mono/diheme cytochrome c family protein
MRVPDGERERNAVLRSVLIVVVAGLAGGLLYIGRDTFALAAPQTTPAAPAAPAAAGSTMTPAQRADSTPKGQLKNPHSDTDSAIVQAGQQLYMSYGCSGCHGGTGGGGMCPPLTNDIWVYGGDDDTLFRLVAYGSQDLRSKGYSRTGQENVVGDMPAMGQIVKTDDDLWKILAFVRANYHGAPECKFGCGAK